MQALAWIVERPPIQGPTLPKPPEETIAETRQGRALGQPPVNAFDLSHPPVRGHIHANDLTRPNSNAHVGGFLVSHTPFRGPSVPLECG